MGRLLAIAVLGLAAEAIHALFWLTTAFMHESMSLDVHTWMFGLAGLGLLIIPVGFAACAFHQPRVALVAAGATALTAVGVIVLYALDATLPPSEITGSIVALAIMGFAPALLLVASARLGQERGTATPTHLPI